MPDTCRHAAYCASCLTELIERRLCCAICRGAVSGAVTIDGATLRSQAIGDSFSSSSRLSELAGSSSGIICSSEQMEQNWEAFIVKDRSSWERWQTLSDADREDVNNMFDRSLDELMGRYGHVLSRASYSEHSDRQFPWLSNPCSRAELERTSLFSQRPTELATVMEYVQWKLRVLAVKSQVGSIALQPGVDKSAHAYTRMRRMRETKNYIHWVVEKEVQWAGRLRTQQPLERSLQQLPPTQQQSQDQTSRSTATESHLFAESLARDVLCKGVAAPTRVSMLGNFPTIFKPQLDLQHELQAVPNFILVLKATKEGKLWQVLGLPSAADASADARQIGRVRDWLLGRAAGHGGESAWAAVLADIVVVAEK